MMMLERERDADRRSTSLYTTTIDYRCPQDDFIAAPARRDACRNMRETRAPQLR